MQDVRWTGHEGHDDHLRKKSPGFAQDRGNTLKNRKQWFPLSGGWEGTFFRHSSFWKEREQVGMHFYEILLFFKERKKRCTLLEIPHSIRVPS